jgi:undecaprenyl pyrophosphate phosphatase UppP
MKNYSTYTNNFTYGRDLVKKLIIAAVIACVLGLLTQSNPTLQTIFVAVSTLVFIYAIYIIIKYCRCPNCNKVIFLGLLAAKTCPRCKRSLTTGQKVKKSKAGKY